MQIKKKNRLDKMVIKYLIDLIAVFSNALRFYWHIKVNK